MSNQKIAGILIPMATSKEVLKEFSRYIKDAHPDNAVHLTALVKYILKKRKSIAEEDFDKEKVFEILFPEEPYKASRMDRIYAKTIKLSEDFLIRRGLEKRPYLRNMILAEALNDLQLEQRAKRKLENNLDNLPDAEEERFVVREQTYRQLFFKVEKNLKEKKKNRKYLVQGLIDLDIATTIGKLKYFCEFILRDIVLGEPIEPTIQEIIQRNILEIPYRKEIPLVDIQAEAISFLLQPSLEGYNMLKLKFTEYMAKLHSEKKELLMYLINGLAFIKHKNRLAEYFSLNKLGVENGLFIEHNEMAPSNFNNIVYIASENGEVEWLEKFKKEHFRYLKKSDKWLQNIETLYQCFLNYGKQNYQETLNGLEDVIFEDFSYGLYKYSLLLKCTYEVHKQTDFSIISEVINAFRSFLNRKQDQQYMSEARKKKYTNSLNALSRIVKYPYDEKLTKEDLIAYYEAFNGNIVYENWLQEKIALLKG